jgi:peptidyl-prolyl cis-trans isomerase D
MFIIAILVIPAFVLWGVGSAIRSHYTRRVAGKVFSKKITRDEFLKQYKAVYVQNVMIYGENLNKVKDYLNLEGQTWQRIILLQEAKRRKIKVANQEVIDWIKKSPLFQRDGKFDLSSYETILKYYLGIGPKEFEEIVRDNLKIKKLMDKITENVKVTEDEAWQEFRKQNTGYKFSYIVIKPSNYYPDVKVTEQELIDFYNHNKEEFKKPQTVNIVYLKIDSRSFLDKVKVSPQEIEDYFQEHKQEFETQKEGENKTEAKNESKQEEKEKQNVQTQVELTPEIRTKIENILKNKKAKQMAEDIAWEIKDKLSQGKTFQEITQEYSLSPAESGYFSPLDPIPGIGWSYKITQTAFKLQPGEISDVIELGDTYFIIKVKDKKPPYIPEFKEVKQQVELKLKKKKADVLAQKAAQKFLNEILKLEEEHNSLEEYLKENNLVLKTTEIVTRNKYISGIGPASQIIDNLTSPEKGKFYIHPIRTNAGYLIVRIDDIIPPDKEKFENEKKTFIEKLTEEKKNKRLQEWFNQLKERANLEVYFTLKGQGQF